MTFAPGPGGCGAPADRELLRQQAAAKTRSKGVVLTSKHSRTGRLSRACFGAFSAAAKRNRSQRLVTGFDHDEDADAARRGVS